MKVVEYHYGNKDGKHWLDRLLNRAPLLIDTTLILPCVALVLGHKRNGKWHWGKIMLDGDGAQSLYHNGIFFIRLMLPFYAGASFRWSGRSDHKAYLQVGAGWKLNGRFTITLRTQSDETSALGVTGPNSGQACGWNEGTK